MTETTQDAAPSLQEQLIADGAHANTVDIQAIIVSLQNRIASLEGERGVPSDPIKGSISNLIEHVKARIAQHPNLDAKELLDTLEKLPEESTAVTADHANLVKTLVDEVMLKHVKIAHDVAYWPELAMSLTKAVAKSAPGLVVPVVSAVTAAV
jgi:hypothetical protein